MRPLAGLPRLEEGTWADSARACFWPFLVTRALVFLALAGATFFAHALHPTGALGLKAIGTSRAGLLSWDGSWYEKIASLGYAGAGRQALRFFPLYPLAARYLAYVPGISVRTALVLIANLSSFAALVVFHHLVEREHLSRESASRSVWVISLWPAAFVFVMGYSEGLLLLFAVATFYLLRSGRPLLSAAPAFLAGATRPVGLLLAVPVLVEAYSWWRSGRRGRINPYSWPVAFLAAPAGAAAYLGWVAARYGDFFLPFSIQTSVRHRGLVADPFTTLFHDSKDLFGGHHLGTALHAPFLVAFVALAVYLFFRLPASYAFYTAVMVAVAATAPNLDSFERYGLAAFPLAIGVAALSELRVVERIVLSGLGAVLFSCALLSFLGLYVP